MRALRPWTLRAFVAVTVALRATHGLAADTWLEAKSPNFTVVSNAGEKNARNVAWQFEQIRSAIEKGLPWARVRLNRPVLILAVKNEASMKEMAPAYWEKGDIHPGSVLSSLGDRHYILLRTDVEAEDREGVNPHRQAYWSYSALTIDSSFSRPLPLWFSRGLAAVLSNSIVRDKEIQFGRVIPGFVRVLQQQPRLRLEELLAIDPKSQYFTTEPTRTRYDAQCWLLMQYLFFGETAEQGNWSRINTLSRELAEGKSSAEAIKNAYGAVEKLDNESLRYLNQGLMKYVRMRVDGAVTPEKYPIRNVTAAEADAARAGFHVSMGRLVEARALLTPAMQADGQQPALSEIEGMIFDRENKPAAAREAYQRAADLDSTNFYVYLRLANLSLPTNDRTALAATQKLLAKSIALNDAFAPSYSSLANVLLQLNQPDGALGLSERAVILEPGQFNYRLLAARILQRLSRRDDARKAAADALELALTDQQRQAAQTLLNSLDRPAPPAGIVGGVIGGVAGGVAFASPPAPPPPAGAVRVGGSIKAPAKVKDVRASYPAEARDARAQGTVILEATISRDGTVQNARVLRSIPLLDAAALDAVRRWEYVPTMVNGQPVPVIVTVTVTFTMQ